MGNIFNAATFDFDEVWWQVGLEPDNVSSEAQWEGVGCVKL